MSTGRAAYSQYPSAFGVPMTWRLAAGITRAWLRAYG